MIKTVEVKAGFHNRRNCPVRYGIEKKLVEGDIKNLLVRSKNTKQTIGSQFSVSSDRIDIEWMVDYLGCKESRLYEILINEETCSICGIADTTEGGVELAVQEKMVDFFINGSYFTTYYHGTDVPKQYLGPVVMGDGDRITRLDANSKDHRHHRSLWISHGSVNGVDTWGEGVGKDTSSINTEIRDIDEGSVYGQLTALNRWLDDRGNALLDEETTYKIYNTPDYLRILDADIRLKAVYGRVVLGQTKEAGPFAVRVAENMKADSTGTIVNGYGGINESECWMKRAPWCDYYGVENGRVYGIAILDNPMNKNYPTYWHVRNYALMSPNNFYVLGDMTIEEGSYASFKYRVLFHAGDTWTADVASHFHNYINSPEVREAEG